MGVSLLLSSPLAGQLHRRTAVPHPPDSADLLLVGLGVGMDGDAVFPLSGLEGDLARLGTVTVAYGFAPGALLLLEGDVLRLLRIRRRDRPSVPLNPGVADGTTRDAGDFRLATVVRLVGDARGWSGGVRLEVKLPNSDEKRGIGLNTTDFLGGVFGSWAEGPWRVGADVGVGILEAPLETFEQDDVLTYRLEARRRLTGTPLQVALSAEGHANTRGNVPVGTEDRGAVRTRVELPVGDWRLDAGLGLGYAGISPGWSVEIGAARLLEP